MTEIKCLWCGKPFDWDNTMFRFCDNCIGKIEETEQVVQKLIKARVNLCKELETLWGRI